MKEKLRLALDQSLNTEINELFRTLVFNKISSSTNSNEPINAFHKGLSVVCDAYGQASLVIDQMTEV